MCRRSRANLIAAWGIAARGLAAMAVAGAASSSYAQTPSAMATTDDVVHAYLADNELIEPLAAALRARLATTAASERLPAAERLGALYVKMLARAATPEARQDIEARARELLETVPEAETIALRLNISKASYQRAEEIAEQERLRLATPDQRAEAERILRELTPAFADMGDKLTTRVAQLERQESNARDTDADQVRANLAEARSLRSLAKYYAGWSEYYGALLTRNPSRAKVALEQFGPLLNAVRNRPATVDRFEPRMLRYEHVARAAVGCALACSLAGDHVEASRWLGMLERSDALPKAINDQLFAYKAIVLAGGSRWPELEAAIRGRRQPPDGSEPVAFTTVEARLLAVLALETNGDSARSGDTTRASQERVAQAGLAELVAKGEVRQVLDIVSRYGTAPIGQSGFVVTYVRGLQAYDKAKTARDAAAAATPSTPPTPPAAHANKPVRPPGPPLPPPPSVVNQFREAASLLEAAIASPDAAAFPAERAGAMITRGLALFEAGDCEAAAAQLESAHDAAPTDVQKRDALWYAVVAINAATTTKPSVKPTLQRLATLYVQQYPASENAAKLLLMQTGAEAMSEDKAIEVLSKLPPESPLWRAAQRQIARVLYASARGKPAGSERDFASARFAQAAEDILRAEQPIAAGGTDARAKEAAEEVILRSRQLADILMMASHPDATRVEVALGAVEGLASLHGIDLSPFAAELAFRRLQVALAKGDDAGMTAQLDTLRGLGTAGGQYAAKGESLVFQRVCDEWRANKSDVQRAGRLVARGSRISAAATLPPGVLHYVRDATAEAAYTVWAAAATPAERDRTMRDIALTLDRAQLDAGVRTLAGLRRVAELSEDAGDAAASLGAWNELLLSLPAGGGAWWEARYHSLRLALAADPQGAATALRQHQVLHPEPPPAEWRERITALVGRIEAADAVQTPPSGVKAGGG